MLSELIVIALSGALGAIARYGSYVAGRMIAPTAQFPWVTLLVNVLGCVLMGVVMTFVERAVPFHRHLYLIGAVGFLGSFTTFSTFGFETLALLREGQTAWAAASIAGNVVLGILGVWLGGVATRLGFQG